MNRQAGARTTVLFLLAVVLPSQVQAAGLGNLTYTAAELQNPIAYFNAANFIVGPPGSNTALMLRDVFVVMGSYDSGKPPGALHVFDVKDPRKPKLLKTVAGTPETADLRELHAMPVALIDGKDFLVMPTTVGVRFFDFTDPMNPKPSGALTLSGVNGGDYDNAAWQLSWSWPYLFVGGTGNGVYIVDATNPAAPTLVTRVATGELGNFRVGPVHAAGNYLVVSGMDEGPTKISVLDVSNPRAPFLLSTGAAPAEMYSAVVIGDRIFGAGLNGNYSFVRWSPTAVSMIAQKKFGTDKGGYCTYQDGFALCGQSSEGYRKIDMRNEADIKEVGHGDIPDEADADTDFATVMGNLVFLGNDHGSGAAFIPHSMTPDTTGPSVVRAYPGDEELRVPLSTRVTVFFSDEINIGSITAANVIIRPVGGAAVAGVFTHSSFNAVTFGPRQPLAANTTYEVVIPAGGLTDLMGNPIATATTIRFSTGTSISGGGGAGGAGTGGMGGRASGGAGGGGSSGSAGSAGSGTGGGPGAAGGGGGRADASGGATIPSSGGAGGAVVGTGGAPASGGATAATGSGGATSTGGAGVPTTGGSGGCACSTGPRSMPAGVASVMLLIVLAGARRRRTGGPGTRGR